MATADIERMRRALALADKGRGLTRPNPPVGAVLTDSSGMVVGEGYHRRAGTPHAEVHALRAAGARASGGTLFVTLEPCSTHGLTPPCTELIIRSGVQRVVVSVKDPNPRHGGRGLALLRRAGLDVDVGVCRSEGTELLAPFAQWVTTGLPFVTLKLASTLDGRIADPSGDSKWITSATARRQVQELRRGADAIMVGAGTVLADDPSLLYRPRRARGPRRVVVDARGRVPATSRIFTDGFAKQTIVATTLLCPDATLSAYVASGAVVWRLPVCRGGVSIRALMRRLGREGILHVLCEGGGRLAGELVRQKLVDRYIFFMAPVLFGERAVPGIAGQSWSLRSAPALQIVSVAQCGCDVRIDAVPRQEK